MANRKQLGLAALIGVDVGIGFLTFSFLNGIYGSGFVAVLIFPGLLVTLLGQGTGMTWIVATLIAISVNVAFYTLLILLVVRLMRLFSSSRSKTSDVGARG